MTDAVVKRLHIGGLTPTITPEHLRDRFKSFGKVLDIEETGVNALGDPRPFAFLTIETTPVQLRKCLNIMSGAMWRGTQLRIAEAKPRWDARLEKERTPSVRDEVRRANRRLRRGFKREGGKHAQDMSVVTEDNVTRRTFWIDDNGHLIRPLAMRPAHPLPPVLGVKPRERADPPSRSYRRVIDPRRWSPSHLGVSELAGDVVPGSLAEEWEFVDEEEDGDIDEDGRVLLGWWKRGDEEVEVRARRPRTDMDWSDAETESDAGSDLFPARSASPLFPSRGAERSASPLFPVRNEGGSSPLFPLRDRAAVLREEEDDETDRSSRASTPSPSPTRLAAFETKELAAEVADEAARTVRADSPPLSPLKLAEAVAIAAEQRAATDEKKEEESEADRERREATPPISPLKAAEGVAIAAREREAAARAAVDIPEQLRTQAAAERTGALGVLASLLGDASSSPPAPAGNAWADKTYDDDSDDGDYSALKPQTYAGADDDEIEVARAAVASPIPDIPSYPLGGPAPLDVEPVVPMPVDAEPLLAVPQLDLQELGGENVHQDGVDAPTDGAGGDNQSAGSASMDESDTTDDTEGASDDGEKDGAKDDSGSAASGSGSSSGSGSGSSSDDSDSDDSGSGSDSDSSDSDSDSDESDDDESESGGAPSGGMKGLFDSGPSSGGGLLATIAPDLEIDENVVLPTMAQPESAAPELAPLATAPKSTFDADPNIPLFFPLPVRPVRRGEARSVLAEPEAEEAQDEEQHGWGEPAPKAEPKRPAAFARDETDAEMRDRWEKRRLELTRGWKRRHREAVKHRRRRGGDDAE